MLQKFTHVGGWSVAWLSLVAAAVQFMILHTGPLRSENAPGTNTSVSNPILKSNYLTLQLLQYIGFSIALYCINNSAVKLVPKSLSVIEITILHFRISMQDQCCHPKLCAPSMSHKMKCQHVRLLSIYKFL